MLVLEKGPLLRPQYQSADRLSATSSATRCSRPGPEKRLQIAGWPTTGESYYSSHVEPDLNDEPHVYRDGDGADRATIEGYTAQVVGGGTQLYGGVSLRFSPDRLRGCSRSTTAAPTAGRSRTTTSSARPATGRSATTSSSPTTAKAERLVGINGTRENQIKPASRRTTTSARCRPTPSARTARRVGHGRARA